MSTSKAHLPRRNFLIKVVSSAAGLAYASQALSQTSAAVSLVSESDPQALALGFKTDATTVDLKKYPTFSSTQKCANCALYQAKASDEKGGCAIFAGKAVYGKSWCSAYAKKPA